MKSAFIRLLGSSKFLLALLGTIETIVLYYFSVPNEIVVSVNALLVVVIAGIAYEDGQAKSGSYSAAGELPAKPAE